MQPTELQNITILKTLIHTPPHMSKETNEREESKATNVHLKFSLIFVCSQVKGIMATFHKRSLDCLRTVKLSSMSCPCPLSSVPSLCSLPLALFPFLLPEKQKYGIV